VELKEQVCSIFLQMQQQDMQEDKKISGRCQEAARKQVKDKHDNQN
jgi:hypothetical protein